VLLSFTLPKIMNTERHKSLKLLRPILDVSTENASAIEKFQSEVLRPILKFQHPLLLGLFMNYLQEKTINFRNLSSEQQQLFIKNTFQKDNTLKNRCLGCIIGLFTSEDLDFYFAHASEINKRIMALLITRISTQTAAFI
jgi:hypothetical protein